MQFRRVIMRWSLMLPVLLLTLTACPFSPDHGGPIDPKPDPDYKPRISISNVLDNLKTSYNLKNIEEIQGPPARILYLCFRSSGRGAARHPGVMGKPDDILSAEHLFNREPNADGYRMDSITLSFEHGIDVVSPVDPTWRKVTLSQIQLLIDTRHATNGDQLRYEVLGDEAYIHFIQTDEIDPESGSKLWQIIYWEDRPVTLLAKN